MPTSEENSDDPCGNRSYLWINTRTRFLENFNHEDLYLTETTPSIDQVQYSNTSIRLQKGKGQDSVSNKSP